MWWASFFFPSTNKFLESTALQKMAQIFINPFVVAFFPEAAK